MIVIVGSLIANLLLDPYVDARMGLIDNERPATQPDPRLKKTQRSSAKKNTADPRLKKTQPILG